MAVGGGGADADFLNIQQNNISISCTGVKNGRSGTKGTSTKAEKVGGTGGPDNFPSSGSRGIL